MKAIYWNSNVNVDVLMIGKHKFDDKVYGDINTKKYLNIGRLSLYSSCHIASYIRRKVTNTDECLSLE